MRMQDRGILDTLAEKKPGVNATGWPAWFCRTHHTFLVERSRELVCRGGERHPVREGIPRLVPDSQYTAAFGAQWNKYRLTQLDSYTGTMISRDRVRRCLGESLWNELEGKQILECGCGAGRFTEILLSRGARVTSIDLSEAVEANAQNFPQSGNHRVAQADILNLPFQPQQYDVVFCVGVVQHTPNPEETIAALYDHVKPGGHLIIDHYRFRPILRRVTTLTPIYRAYLRRLSPEKGMKCTESLVRFFFPLHKLARNFRVLDWAICRVSPVHSYFRAFPMLSDELQFEMALLDTHDVLTDWYKHSRTREQIESTFERLGLQDICCEDGGNGIEARGRRPTV